MITWWSGINRLLRILSSFAEHREVIIRSGGRVAYIPMPRMAQAMLLVIVLGAGGWIVHSSSVYFRHYDLISGKELELAEFEERNEALLARMGAMRSEFTDVSGTLERNHRSLADLVEGNTELKNALQDMRIRLRQSENKRAEQTRRQIALNRQLINLEAQLAASEEKSSDIASKLDRTKNELTAALMDRTAVESTRDWLKMRVKGLEERLSAVKESQEGLVVRMSSRTMRDIDRVERLIAGTGLKLSQLIKDDKDSGAGGPFIPVVAGEENAAAGGVETFDRQLARWEQMQNLVKQLPLVAPMHHYRVTSSYGRRSDPINGKSARHDGIDLSGPIRSPIYATAPGKVVFSGWKGGLGRLVEIDHGNGIRTRYAHLRSIHVKRGQEVEFGQRIGQLGSSGRSTGPHVHYEITVRGKNVDPEKFLKAGRDVFKG
jgi:murein DD-endopeptidase MepM/ murein hydrolase activator NlpD